MRDFVYGGGELMDCGSNLLCLRLLFDDVLLRLHRNGRVFLGSRR
ncbi:Uncharacterised protein [Vibrio cholerae]|nr:Uncharacterised protein [Vibrio cholerae]